MVHFSDMIGTSMADMMGPNQGTMSSAVPPENTMEISTPTTGTEPSIMNAMVEMEMGPIVDDAQSLVAEVTEQMAMLSSMQEGMNPERVASLLMMPALME